MEVKRLLIHILTMRGIHQRIRKMVCAYFIFLFFSILVYSYIQNEVVDFCTGKDCELRGTGNARFSQHLKRQSSPNLSYLRMIVLEHNKLQKVHNEAMLTSFDTTSTGVVFLVQVWELSDQLKLLVESLKAIYNIHTSLIIFSHTFIHEDLNSYIAQLDFAPMLQIYFPFSIQLYPHEYPGLHPNDCLPTEDIIRAERRRCNNYDFYDGYNNFRNANSTQEKHFWLWSVLFAFEKVRLLHNFQGLLFLLDDRFFLLQDSLYVIRKAAVEILKHTRQCTFFLLGLPLDIADGLNQTKGVESPSEALHKTNWVPGKGIGLGMRRCLLKKLKICFLDFCTIDDDNWDWSLFHTARKCFHNYPIIMFKPEMSRTYRSDSCREAAIRTNNSCLIAKIKQDIDKYLQNGKLFPESLHIVPDPTEGTSYPNLFGGWSDPRDQALCKSLVVDIDAIDLKSIENKLHSQ